MAAERAVLGIIEPVYLPNLVWPAETGDIMKAEYEAGIKARGGVEGLLKNLAILRDMGYMPMIALNLSLPVSKNGTVALATRETSRQLELVRA